MTVATGVFCNVAAVVEEIICEALFLAEKGQIKPGTLLVGDLKAEVIDFIDILNRIAKAFGIEIPRGELVPDFAVDSTSRDGITFQTIVDYVRGKIVVGILCESLDKEMVRSSDRLVQDLGAETPDFLDIGYKLEQVFPTVQFIKDGKPVADFDVESLSRRGTTVQDVVDYVKLHEGVPAV